MTQVDLGPAAQRLAELVRNVPDDALANPTPCPDYTLGDLVDHVGVLALAFTAAAKKESNELTNGTPPLGDASQLVDDWRARIPRDLAGLVQAWKDPEAWDGMTRIAGGDAPAAVIGQVALNELVVHGWDVAQASGQPYVCDEPSLESARDLLAMFSGPDDDEARAGGFGPVVMVADDAPLLDHVLGMSGRDPDWSAP
jgi:uncharacterized protein (TIGR03086 family)